MTMTNPTQAKQEVRAALLVYLNRLRVIHGLTELDMLEVFNAVGATAFKEMLEGRAVAVAKPVQQVNVKNDNTVIMTRDDLNKIAQTETWDKLLGPDE